MELLTTMDVCIQGLAFVAYALVLWIALRSKGERWRR